MLTIGSGGISFVSVTQSWIFYGERHTLCGWEPRLVKSYYVANPPTCLVRSYPTRYGLHICLLLHAHFQVCLRCILIDYFPFSLALASANVKMSLRLGRTSTTSTPTTPNRPSIPAEDVISPVGGIDPFATPYLSQRNSLRGSSSATSLEPRFFHSRRVQKGSVEQPWRDKKDPKEKWVTIIPLFGLLVGLGITGVLIWDGLRSVVNHVYCPILSEDWSNGINTDIWTKEAEVGGFG